MKKDILALLLVFTFLTAAAQHARVEKLRQQLKQHTPQDTFRVNRLVELVRFQGIPATEQEAFANEALTISRKIKYASGEGSAINALGYAKFFQGEKSDGMALMQQAVTIGETIHDDALRFYVLMNIGNAWNRDADNKQAIAYMLRAEAIAEKVPDKALLARCQTRIALLYCISLSDYPKAMDWALKSVKTAQEANCQPCLVNSWFSFSTIYTAIGDNKNALIYDKRVVEANEKLGDEVMQFNILTNIGERNRLTGNYPEAIKAYNQALELTKTPYRIGLNQSNLADVYVRMGDLPMGFKYAFSSLDISIKLADLESISWIDGILARAYLKQNKTDSALYYAKNGFTDASKVGSLEFMRDNTEALANGYAQKQDFSNAYKYHKLYISFRDSMVNSQVTNQGNLMQYNLDLQKKQAQIASLNEEKRLQRYFMIGILVILGLIILTVFILIKNNRQKQKANQLLSEQKEEIKAQRDNLGQTLDELKNAQTQLVQREKMASLGELTAGIAHEIQNPLNFVNNFSEVNQEMLGELEAELNKGNIAEAKAITADIRQNEEKINHHGKRADFIVKGMLLHSRNTTGEKEATNINAMANEFLKLSYHGLRAKDKNFNAELVTNFDNDLPKVIVAHQDIGRVLLNLFNNAFYAVNQKQKTAGDDYKPEVSVSTSIDKNKLVISVKDNGNGIPSAIKDKIMQPFFTTKPTGEGTGLGLSLSYDIVVKGHGGTITVDTKEGEFTEFVVHLPV